MMLRYLPAVALLLCAPAFAESDAIAVTVSRNVDLPPDAVYYSMAIAAEPDTTLEQVLQATQDLGLSAQNLMSLNLQQYGPSPSQTRLAYAFDLSVPFSRFRETNDKIAAVRRSMAAATPAMELQVFTMAVAPGETAREQARQRLLVPLFEDARLRAEQLAKAASVTLGGVVGVSEAWAPTGAYPGYGPYGPVGPSTLKTAFSMTVRYAVK
jgi:uncharacterized protein YggE